MTEKILLKILLYHFRCILLKNSISGAKNSLKCKNVGQFHFFFVFIQIKSGLNKVNSHFRLFLAPGIEFFGKNTSVMVYFKKFESFFCHILTKMHISPNTQIPWLSGESKMALYSRGQASNSWGREGGTGGTLPPSVQ